MATFESPSFDTKANKIDSNAGGTWNAGYLDIFYTIYKEVKLILKFESSSNFAKILRNSLKFSVSDFRASSLAASNNSQTSSIALALD